MQINNDLLNAITPFGGLEFFRHKLYLGENHARIYAVTKYPPTMPRGWASKITELPNTFTCQIFEPYNNISLIKELSDSIRQNKSKAITSRDASVQQRAERESEDAARLIKQIQEENQVIGYMSNLVMVIGRDEAELEATSKRLEGVLAGLGCRMRLVVNQMKEAFKTISPAGVPQEEVLALARRNVPMSSFIQGYPFAATSFVDRDGYPFARNSKNGLVVLNPWTRGGDRTNSNFTFIGAPGSGKSTALKLQIESEFMMGTTVIIIDPQREYQELVLNLGGSLVNAGGGSFIINPLQFRNSPVDPELEFRDIFTSADSTYGVNAMALHFKRLEIFFKLYAPEITTRQMGLLKRLLEQLYGSFGVTWASDTSSFSNSDWPTFTDLYHIAKEARTKGEYSELWGGDVFDVEIMLRELAEGADSFIWNGYTTVEPRSAVICLDTFDLKDSSPNVKEAQYYNILSWTWERASRDRNEKVLIVADEAHIMVDPQVPQALMYLDSIERQVRKYSGMLTVASHGVVDFLDPAIKQYGQSLLDSPTYKVLMGADGQNLKEMQNLYNLSDGELEVIAGKQQGQGVFFAGSRRFIIKFMPSEYEMRLMGSGGGR